MQDPPSTHSSPRSFSEDLPFPHYAPAQHQHHHAPQHSLTYPLPAFHRPLHKSTLPPLPIALSVSTSTAASDHDPNESTARPSNAHKHAQFLAGALTSSHSDDPARSLLFTGHPVSADDPGATPVVAHPPPSVAATGLPTPLPTADPAAEMPSAAPTDSDPDYALESGIARALSRPLTAAEQEKLAHLDRLKFFLATAPSQWDNARSTQSFAPTTGSNAYPSASVGVPSTVGSSTGWGMGLPPGNPADGYTQGIHPSLNRFMLPSQEFVTCVLWNGLYHITGTDIVRALVFRFEAFGRPVRNMKKFEEGVFSDLRNLKPGVDACLEEPKSPFLDLLFKYQCIRTQKKQKVFYWFSVPHDRLFLDALERDLKREKMGFEPTTHVVGEPAHSFTYDPKRSLYEQFAKSQGLKDGEADFDQRAEIDPSSGDAESDAELIDGATNLHIDTEDSEMSDIGDDGLTEEEREKKRKRRQEQRRKRHLSKMNGNASSATFFSNLFGLFEGSPTYKQRRKKNPASGAAGSSILSRSVSSSSSAASFRRGSEDFDDRGRPRSMGSFSSGLAERHHHHSTSVSRERSYPYPHPYTHIHRQSSSSSLGGGSHPFQYSSMEEEFGPGSMDARERAELDAATLFHRQARGELIPADGVIRKPKVPHVLPEVGVMISEGFTAHPVQNTGTSQTGSAYHHDSQIDGYPSNGFDPTSLLSDGHTIHSASASTSSSASNSPYETVLDGSGVGVGGEGGKVRAFMCPLYSCGRLFKRMEHLKRHVRTHTLERPFSCPICQRKFSRSDNLNQHLKTHDRPGSGGSVGGMMGSSSYGGGGGTGGGNVTGLDGGGLGAMNSMGGGGGGGGGGGFDPMTTMGMWRDNGNGEDSDLSGAEEGFDDDFVYHQHQHPSQAHPQHPSHMMFGLPHTSSSGGGFGLGIDATTTTTTTGGGRRGSAFDMQMCEIEVQASEISEMAGGEEEGLVFRNHHHHPLHHHSLQQQQQQHQEFSTNASGVTSSSEYAAPDSNWQQQQQQQQQQASSSTSSPPPPASGRGAPASSAASFFGGGLPTMNSLGAIGGMMDMGGGMGGMNAMGTLDNMNSLEAMNTMNAMNPMNPMNTMNTMNSFNTMNTMNTMGTINAMVPPNEFAPSVSAPSHKRSFDHVALYHTTANILESSSNTNNTNTHNPTSSSSSSNSPANSSTAAAGGVLHQQQQQQGLAGPMRRHRSMTPSLAGRASLGGGESIRRPMSTVSNASSSGGGGVEGGSGRGSGSASPVPTGRVYHHSYAGTTARSGSAHSSPAVYNTPLSGEGGVGAAGQQGLRRSESRTSFVGHPLQHHQHHQHQIMESPVPYGTMELPPLAQAQGMYGYDPQQQQQQQQQGGQREGEYYSHTI